MDRERLLVEQLRVAVAGQIAVERRQAIQRCRDVGMVGTERLLVVCQQPFVERLRVGVTALSTVKLSQGIQRLRNVTMIGPNTFSRIASDRL